MYRIRLAVLAAVCLAAAGCVEGEVTYTVNPDGSAKVKFDVVTVKPVELTSGPGVKKEEDKDIDDLVRDALRPVLQTQQVYAWKDVEAEYLPNGKLHVRGTAYVKNLQDFRVNSLPLLQPNLTAERGADGPLKLVSKKDDPNGQPGLDAGNKRKHKTPDEVKKLSDADLDKYILRDLIDLQAMRPMLAMVLGGAKLKYTYALPGDPGEAPGFVRDGRKLSAEIKGDELIAAVNGLLAKDQAGLRKFYRDAGASDPVVTLIFEGAVGPTGPVTVAKPEAQFDFDKEVKAAREAYPALKKKFGFKEGDDVRLPTEDPKPIPKGFPPPPPPAMKE